MGLGKTLQTITIVASDIYYRKYKSSTCLGRDLNEKQKKNVTKKLNLKLVSIVICPPTLMGHWFHEIKKFSPDLICLQYDRNINGCKNFRLNFETYDIVIMSYDILRNDMNQIVNQYNNWNYCILDEGHIIKNNKTQITKSVKRIIENY
jgi:TATA-binding protein-associated factor